MAKYQPKGWYDLSSWRKEKNIVTVWFKDLNDGTWPLTNGKKVWYNIAQIQANCGERKIQILNITDYDLKGNVISSYNFSETSYYEFGRTYIKTNWQSVIPDSMGEEKYMVMCSLY